MKLISNISSTPFLCVLDEYGYYAVKGFAVVPAQARSLGFSVIFAGQDLPAFQKASKEEAASIGANCNIKICMKLEDPTETWDFFMKGAGESYVAQVESFQSNAGSLAASYQDTRGARLEKRARIDLQDLKEQSEGQSHIFFKSTIVRASMFYAAPPPVPAMRLNQFLSLDLPPDNDLYVLVKGIEDFEVLCKQKTTIDAEALKGDLAGVVDKLNDLTSGTLIERAVSVLMSQHVYEVEGKELDGDHDLAGVSIFSGFQSDILLQQAPWLEDDLVKEASKPILKRQHVQKQLAYLSQLLGVSMEDAEDTTEQIVYDLGSLTDYHDIFSTAPKRDEVLGDIQAIVQEMNAVVEVQLGEDE